MEQAEHTFPDSKARLGFPVLDSALLQDCDDDRRYQSADAGLHVPVRPPMKEALGSEDWC